MAITDCDSNRIGSAGGYRASHRDPCKPAAYDPQFFELGTTLNLFWEIEQCILADLLAQCPKRSRVLDFACGTGRILSWLAGRFDDTTGVDVSESMIEAARKRSPTSRIVEGDLTVEPGLVEGPFDVVTAFRFFLNAERALQTSALRAIRDVISEQGLLVANFHLNPNSLTGMYLRILSILRRSKERQAMMTPADACRLLLENNFRPVEIRGYGYFLHRTRGVTSLVAFVERFLAGKGLRSGPALNFIIVARPA